MIDFDKALAVWFYNIPPNGSYLGALLRENERLIFRWRIADPSGKRWYEGTPPRALAETIEDIRWVTRAGARIAQLDGTPQELLRGTLPEEEWVRLLLAQPWVHAEKTHPAEHA